MARAGAALIAASLALVGCANAGTSEPAALPQTTLDAAKPTIVAAFYPLAYAASGVAGDSANVITLTPPGVEPHDLELSAAQTAQIAKADLVLYAAGFQPAVDEAVAQQAPDKAIDIIGGTVLPDGERARLDADPHAWLNPRNLGAIGHAIADRLTGLDPASAPTFASGAATLDAAMTTLDQEYRTGLANCASRTMVVSHEAFGYLADAYGLQQVGLSGLSPDAEPSPARLAEVTNVVRDQGITTIYYETLVDPKVATTIADETGATTAVLDPLEGLAPESTGDYASIMRANLQTLIAGQRCS